MEFHRSGNPEMIGGARKGAGRNPVHPILKKKPISIKLPCWLLDRLGEERESRAVLIEEALIEKHGWMAPDVGVSRVTGVRSMKISIIPGKMYVVTKPSDDGTFEVGDHISMNEDGSINNREAQGWVDACDVAEATKGLEVEIDKQWIEHRKKKLIAELASLYS